jgi:hypothetical protein
MSVLHNFKIEKIYGERVKKGHKEYHIKWVDYGDDEDTWESETDLIQDGHQKDLDAYKKAKKPSFRLQVRTADQMRTKDVVKKNKTKTTGRHTSRPYPSSTPRFRKKKKPDKKKPDKKKFDKKNPRVDHLEKRIRLKERIRARMALGRKTNNRQRVKRMLTF